MTGDELAARGIKVKELEFEKDFCCVDLGPHLTWYYSITAMEYGLEELDIRISGSEWGPDVIWRGPKGGAVPAAQADYTARILAAMEITP